MKQSSSSQFIFLDLHWPDLSGVGVALCDPVPLGGNSTLKPYHVHWSDCMVFDTTNSKLL